MRHPSRILLQAALPSMHEGWHIGRFSLLRDHLAGLVDRHGGPLFELTARDREPPGAPDSVLSRIDTSDYDQLWLFAVNTGGGLTSEDCEAISRFRRRGGGLLVARGNIDPSSADCALVGGDPAQVLHAENAGPDPSRRTFDTVTHGLSWPDHGCGANGDFQRVDIVLPLHPVLVDPEAPDGAIRCLPPRPHESAIARRPDDPGSRVIATARSKSTGRAVHLMVAFEPSEAAGPAIAESSFHHFADCQWNPPTGAPDLASKTAGQALAHSHEAQRSVRRYACNLALWLGGNSTDVPLA